MNWYLKALKQYADFKGRARRKEFWMFFLFDVIVAIFLNNVLVERLESVEFVYVAIMIIPRLAVSVRRLHDIGKSGWMMLVALVLFVSVIIIISLLESSHVINVGLRDSVIQGFILGLVVTLFVLYVSEGIPRENKYGMNPKEIS